MPMASTETKERQRIDREAQQHQYGKGADDGHWHGQERDDRGAPGLQEDDHHQHHQQHGLTSVVPTFVLDLHEAGGVVDDVV